MKKYIRIKRVNDDVYGSTYASYSFYMAFVDKSGDNRIMSHNQLDCREMLCSKIRRSLLPPDSKYKEKYKINTDVLRLLMCPSGLVIDNEAFDNHRTCMFFAKRVINYVEKLVGIKKKSTIATVIVTGGGKEYTGWLFTGSNEWLNSPVLLSAYTIITRLAYRHKLNNKSSSLPESSEDMMRIMGKWDLFLSNASDNEYIKQKYELLMNIITNRAELFDSDLQKAYYALNSSEYDHYPYDRIGCDSLLKGCHKDTNLQRKINELTEDN